ncbi:receptor kinase-like protein Xa21 [Capsicum annuum]|uniref:receptor kinase-like protein Xa21 n=1 Tax=Capsicum annuum TaxID=4072 RepID=UPI001FB0F489|nr:receptor kinase-like protein Xa21 [Capsicum annuum]
MEIFNISRLRVISLSHNNLSGSLPPTMGSILPNIEELNLGSLTSLVGTIPHSISNCSELAILELSNNQIAGLIPNSIGYLTYLQYLNLALNNLTTDSSLSFLTFFTNCVNLTALSLTLNPPNGMLPASTGNLSTSLKNFYANGLFLSNNKLTGSISDNLCKLHFLDVIDLTQNNFSRSLPYCLGKITSLREIRMGSNKLSTNIPPSLGNIQDLVVLDLSSNNMVGSLPLEIRNLKAATLIDLSMNQFSNRIPREIAGFQNLAHLSLRHNKLQETIPDSMSNMAGEIPSGGPFKNLSSQFFIYNEAFCGSSRFSVPPCPTSSKNISNRKKFLVLFLLLAIAIVFVPMAFVLLWIRYRRGKSAPQQAESYYALLQATDYLRESNLIGFGSFVSVYKGVLRNGTAIAVNVFNLKLDAAFKSFDTECEVLHSLRHRNLVEVITSCSNLDFKALVLDFMPNGSLEMYLYSHNYFLDIKQRLRIMIDVACALEYLHHGCSLPVIHCDVKPSNILLDEDMVAHLSDFGISKLLGEGQGDFYTKTFATFGYIAPEYGLEGLVSTKCDIYSYGVMLLETFTRRKPSEFEGDCSLKQWANYSLPNVVMEVGDANLLTSTGNRLKKELDVVASIMKVALDCCNESPPRRTNMKDVVGMLPKIKIQLLAC